jgi:DNA-binding GntR family transcriptional regulator
MGIVNNMDDSVDNDGNAAVGEGPLANRVLAFIRQRIATGELRPGDRVNELEIARTLSISRGPVREAIHLLSSSGLLVPAPNAGSRVVVLNEALVRQHYEVREALESLAATLAAERMTAAERADLKDMLDRHEAEMDAAHSTTYLHGPSDRDFHLAVLRGARNQVVWRICGDELRDLLGLLRSQHGRRAGRGRRALLEHRWIADAIVDGNADLAGLLMAQHIRASRDNLLAVMADRDLQAV